MMYITAKAPMTMRRMVIRSVSIVKPRTRVTGGINAQTTTTTMIAQSKRHNIAGAIGFSYVFDVP